MAIDMAALRTWLGLPATAMDDEALAQVVAAEEALQDAACTFPTDGAGNRPPHLIQALYRRVGREVAAKNVPLGALGVDSEQGPSTMAKWDAEIERLEGPSRRWVFG
jgi:hypothetical protein